MGIEYKWTKTAVAAIETPAIVIGLGAVLASWLKLDAASAQIIAAAFFGIVNGAINFIKNRHRGGL